MAGVESKDVNLDGKIVYSKRDIQVSEIDTDFWNHDIGQGLELEPEISDSSENPYKEILDLYYQVLYERQISLDREFDQYYTNYNLQYSILDPYWAWESSENILSKEGYAFLDLNDDGVEELLLGWVDNEFWNMDEGYVFAVYTIVDGKAVLAIEGWERCLYVISEDGYLYNSGSSNAWEGNYTKYRFNPEYEEFLEPVEEIYSYMDAKGEVCWKHKTNPVEAGEAESLDSEEAQAIGGGWIASGMKLDYTLFSEYEQIK